MREFHATTIIAVRHDGRVALGGDGQVTLGDTVVKANAQKVRKLKDGRVLAGFAGSVADAFTLFEKFESSSNVTRAICPGPRSRWPRSGERTATCVASRRC